VHGAFQLPLIGEPTPITRKSRVTAVTSSNACVRYGHTVCGWIFALIVERLTRGHQRFPFIWLHSVRCFTQDTLARSVFEAAWSRWWPIACPRGGAALRCTRATCALAPAELC